MTKWDKYLESAHYHKIFVLKNCKKLLRVMVIRGSGLSGSSHYTFQTHFKKNTIIAREQNLILRLF